MEEVNPRFPGWFFSLLLLVVFLSFLIDFLSGHTVLEIDFADMHVAF